MSKSFKKDYKKKKEEQQKKADDFVNMAVAKQPGTVPLQVEKKNSRKQEDASPLSSSNQEEKKTRNQKKKTSSRQGNQKSRKHENKGSRRESEEGASKINSQEDKSSSDEDDLFSCKEENKSSSHQEVLSSPKVPVYEAYEKCNFTIPESLVGQLDDMTSDFRKIYRKKAPNKNHYIIVALRRLFQDIEGEDREVILKELLALREETIERKKPKRR